MGQDFFPPCAHQGLLEAGCSGNGEFGDGGCSPVESSMVNHLHPSRRTALSLTRASLPVFQKIYKSSALAVRALNMTSLLTAYQAELLEEMGCQLDSGSPKPALWEEICIIADLNLRMSHRAVQSCGRRMGLAVVGERSLWLGLSGLSDKEKVEYLDAPIDPKAMFGVTATAMCQQCDLWKKEGEAFEVCLPRKPAARPYHPSRPNFRPSGRGGHSNYQTSRPAPPQQPGNVGPQSKPGFVKPKQSFAAAAAAAKHRSATPQGNKKRRST